MTGPKAEYSTGTPETEPMTCQQCGYEIGTIWHAGELDLLQLGGSMTKDHHGQCFRCGAGFHWHISDQALTRIIRSAIILRRNDV